MVASRFHGGFLFLRQRPEPVGLPVAYGPQYHRLVGTRRPLHHSRTGQLRVQPAAGQHHAPDPPAGSGKIQGGERLELCGCEDGPRERAQGTAFGHVGRDLHVGPRQRHHLRRR